MSSFPHELGGLPAGDDWRIQHHLAFSLEVPARRIEPLLPAGVSAVRPVPGRALLQLIHARYVAGTLDDPEPFDEIVCAVLVEPDLSVPMPLPRLTLYVLDVLSNSRRFVEHKVPALKMPVHHAPSLRSAALQAGLVSAVSDDRGPIFELGCPDAVTFKPKAFYGQYFAMHEGALHHSVWAWSGTLFESQRDKGAHLVLHGHPWFRQMGLSDLGRVRCFMRQLSRLDDEVGMRTYAPRLVGARPRGATEDVVRPAV